MSDIRVSWGLPQHPKMKRLIHRLGTGAAWYYVRLLIWVAQNKPSGILTGMTTEDIEIAIDWNCEQGKFIETLAEIGFMDRSKDAWAIHDWAAHNPWQAGANSRKEKARFNALCKHHGKAKALEMMPEYAAVLALDSDDSGTPQSLLLAAKNAATAENGTNPDNSELVDSDSSVSASSRKNAASSMHTAEKIAATARKKAAPLPSPSPSPSPLKDSSNDGHATHPDPGRPFPCRGAPAEWSPPGAKLAEWAEAYPDVDLANEIRKAWQWCQDNPKRRKLAGEMEEFLSRWLAKEQKLQEAKTPDRPRRPNKKPLSPEEINAAFRRQEEYLAQRARGGNSGDNPEIPGTA